MKFEDEGVPRKVSDPRIQVYSAPDGAYEQATSGHRYAHGNYGVNYHHCYRCAGWIKGRAIRVTYAPLIGWQGLAFHCARCGKEIDRFPASAYSRARLSWWWSHVR